MDKILDNGKHKKTLIFYDFGAFRLDPEKRRLMKGEELVALTPKEFEVLFYLVERAGRVAEKGELLDAIWKDTFVEETTLARNVSWLRQKLADGANGEKLIETVPKRGYRFIGKVVKTAAGDALAEYHHSIASEEATGGALVVEEQILQKFLVEETITLEQESVEALMPEARVARQKIAALPAASRATRSRFAAPLFVALTVLAAALLGSFVYLFYFRGAEQKIISVERVAPFSGLPGREAMPAFSPDGKLIAFAWNGGSDENFDVYVKQIGAGGEPVRLTKNESDDLAPAFSPDGSRIAFVRVLPNHSELYLIPALGGAERKICDLRRSSSSISFSPDGRFLAVHDGDDAPGERPGIFLVEVETGAKKRLTAPPDTTADDRPAFAPDNQRIVFVRSFAPLAQELFIVSASGDGEPRQITFDKKWIGGAAWTADGKKIVFASLRPYNSRQNLWQIAVTGDAAPELIAIGSKSAASPAVSGNRIAFVEESYDTNIWRLEPAQFPSPNARRKFAASSFNDHSPNVSPDGKRVVFASQRTGKYEIWIADSDGANARQLTDFKNAPVGSPRFSPDGKQIVFDAQVSGNGDIYQISADGGAPRRLTEEASFDSHPAWSADGSFVFFASDRSGSAQIYRMPVGGGEALRITRNGGRESYAAPDGKSLYYSKGDGGLWRISLENGGGEQPIAALAEAAAWRYWTLSGNGIYFVRRSNYPPFKLMFYDIATDAAKEAATIEAAPIWVYPGLGASPDGKVIYFAQADQNASSIAIAEIGK